MRAAPLSSKNARQYLKASDSMRGYISAIIFKTVKRK